jgi:hypothetical protein
MSLFPDAGSHTRGFFMRVALTFGERVGRMGFFTFRHPAE